MDAESFKLLTPIITGLITILGSGFVVAIVTHFMQTAKEEKQFLRAKLELLYSELSKWKDREDNVITHSLSYQTGTLTADQAVTSCNEFINNDESSDNVAMLCNVYFPRLVPYLDGLKLTLKQSYVYSINGLLQPVNLATTEELLSTLNVITVKFEALKCALYSEGLYVSRPFWYPLSVWFGKIFQ